MTACGCETSFEGGNGLQALGAAQPVIFHSQHVQVAYLTRLPRMQGFEG